MLRRLLLLVMVLGVGVVVALSVALSRLHQSPFDKTPSELRVCGKTYVLPAPQAASRGFVEHQGLTVQAHVWTWQGKRAVWGADTAVGCGNNIYLEIAGNDFRSYSLSASR